MSGQPGLLRLHRLLAERYEALRAQIAHRLGGATDMAEDALHDAYVRLASLKDLDEVKHPRSYLVNTAVNSAIDRIRSEVRLVGEDEIEALFEQGRAVHPAPEREIMGRERAQHVMAAIATLTPRQSALLLAYRVHGEDTDVLARRWGISRGMVRREIRQANAVCLDALARYDGEIAP
ncbi:sigma-70 family RNA polymerase sigma factor [Orrella sp. JC864]|uniref:RNA polymerase sigma factor n=1 Tax=Orrella sp. JC864 TaxID=3120298 RepID=UPI003009232E